MHTGSEGKSCGLGCKLLDGKVAKCTAVRNNEWQLVLNENWI